MSLESTIETQELQLNTLKVEQETNQDLAMKKLSFFQLLNLCIGFLGIQFAWSMQIGLSGRVTEPLGASPLIFGLMWLAGPITGIFVQPVVGVISDKIWTKIGRRRPFLLIGAFLGSLALIAFPLSSHIGGVLKFAPALLIAASLLWVIDACVNISQGPYRALVPDVAPQEQHAIANSYLSFAIGLGSVIAFGIPPLLSAFNINMSITSQFVMAAVALTVSILWTCVTTKETKRIVKKAESNENAFDSIKNFMISAGISAVITGILIACRLFGKIDLNNTTFITTVLSWFVLILSVPMLTMALVSFKSKEIYKVCAIQFFTWLGLMSMFMYFNNFVVHNIFQIPDLSVATEAVKASFNTQVLAATNVSGTGFAVFNAVCMLISLPIGYFCNILGKKNVHTFALATMGLGLLGLAFVAKTTIVVLGCMALAGMGWASILAIPFALLTDHIEPGTEGSAMGKFNLFIAGPQLLSSVAVGYLISSSPMKVTSGMAHHWDYAFIVAGISVIVAAVITQFVKEKCKSIDACACSSGAH